MKKSLTFSMIGIIGALLIFSGCGTGSRTVGQTIDDSWILSKVKSKLAWDKRVYAMDINVDVFQSEVTLSGVVESDEEAKLAEDIALSIKGVQAVHNKLTVVPPTYEEEETAPVETTTTKTKRRDSRNTF